MKTIRIFASYISHFDKYIANISIDGKDYNLTSENGSELPKKVKKLTGVDIEYNFNERIFIVPKDYSF